MFKALIPLFKETFRQWDAHRVPKMGAALSFYTVFSLAPLAILVLSLLSLAVERSAGTGNLFYTLGLEIYRPVDEARPIQRGLTLTRSYRAGGACSPDLSTHGRGPNRRTCRGSCAGFVGDLYRDQ